jgi:hypothetical protein
MYVLTLDKSRCVSHNLQCSYKQSPQLEVQGGEK